MMTPAREGANLAEIQTELHAHGGELHVANSPSGGLRFLAAVPVEMAMLDGMVVRVGEVMYIVPIDSIQRIVHSVGSDLMRISAEERRYMLKLAQDDVLPVQFLMKSDHADSAGDADPFANSRVAAGGRERFRRRGGQWRTEVSLRGRGQVETTCRPLRR